MHINLKSAILCFFILCSAIPSHAQKAFKNEISIGYSPLGYFFDPTGIRFSAFQKFNSPSLSYQRNINERISVGITLAQCYFSYRTGINDHFQGQAIETRAFKTISPDVGWGISKWGLRADLKAGIRINFDGYNLQQIYYQQNDEWYPSHSVSHDYGRLGVKLGATISHPIYRRFFGSLDAEYAGMWNGADRNQLLLAYRLGIRF